jgi:hypothetical protein
VLNAIEGSSHLPRSQESGSGAAKRLDSSVRGDKLLINQTEWPAMVVGHEVIWEMSAQAFGII